MTDAQNRLLAQSYTFRRLHEEHHSHETRLHELASRPVPTVEEEVEEKHLKKRKLYLKDRMAQIVRDFEATGALPDETPADIAPFPSRGRAASGESVA
jgi:uncharacterized protein